MLKWKGWGNVIILTGFLGLSGLYYLFTRLFPTVKLDPTIFSVFVIIGLVGLIGGIYSLREKRKMAEYRQSQPENLNWQDPMDLIKKH